MRTAYDILLSLTIEHSYFSDKQFESFDLLPDKKTAKLINDLKLVTKKKGNSWNLFFQTDGPFAVTQPQLINKEFFFTLKIIDTTFNTITHKMYLPGRDKMLAFNSPLNSVVGPEERNVHLLKFNYKIHHSARPVNIKVTNYIGAKLIDDTIEDGNDGEHSIDLTAYGENIYNISEEKLPPADLEIEKIFAKEIVNGGPFYGTVYFKVLPINDYPLANQYKINFEANKLTNN